MTAPFLPLFKADQATQTIWARAAAEEPDKAREIMDYASAKPQFEEWSNRFREATLGKSLGNIRAMHSPRHLAGKVTDIVYNDDQKAVDICLKVLDPNDWVKVEEGGYTGLSIGGGYLKKWADPLHKGHIRYTPKISEISLVDAPCIQSARFLELQKRDGSIEEVPLVGHARTFAELKPPPSFAELRKMREAAAIVGFDAALGKVWDPLARKAQAAKLQMPAYMTKAATPYRFGRAVTHAAQELGETLAHRGKTFTPAVKPMRHEETVGRSLNKPIRGEVPTGKAVTYENRGKTFTRHVTDDEDDFGKQDPVLAALEARLEKASLSGVAGLVARGAASGARRAGKAYAGLEHAAADKIVARGWLRQRGALGGAGEQIYQRKLGQTKRVMRVGGALAGGLGIGAGASAAGAGRRRAEKQDPVLAALEDRMEKVAWGEVAEGLSRFGAKAAGAARGYGAAAAARHGPAVVGAARRAAGAAQTYGAKALNTKAGQAVARGGVKVAGHAARGAVGYMKLSAAAGKEGARVGGHIGERVGRFGGDGTAGREWGQAVGAGTGAHLPLAALGTAGASAKAGIDALRRPSHDKLKKPNYMQKSLASQAAPIKPVHPVVFVPPCSDSSPGKTVDQARLKRETDPRSRQLAMPRYMKKSEEVPGDEASEPGNPKPAEHLKMPRHMRKSDPETLYERLQQLDKTRLQMPAYMRKSEPAQILAKLLPRNSERGGGGTGGPLSEKEHEQRIAAAKARWLREEHHDMDVHFDAQKATASKAMLGRDRKMADADKHRANFWHEVANTQEAYDKVRKHLPEHANLMMEVSHAHGLLYNPEGIGGDHFDARGRPKQPLYHMHPTEADDWIAKHGKDVAKAAPGNLVEHRRDLGEATAYASGAFHQLAA